MAQNMRLAVKNLPKDAAEQEIREYFAAKEDVTDVYMLRDYKGTFRRVAFVGFRTSESATSAMKYFNGAMFMNHKITVEIAKEEEKTIKRGESSLRKILYSKTVYIRGITRNVDIEILEKELKKIGKLARLKIEEKEGGSAAIVQFVDGSAALHAVKHIKVLAGMRVRIGVYNEDCNQQQKEYFNSLFFSFDSIVGHASRMARVSERDVVDIKDDKLGSKIALAETSLVAQTREFLADHGINLEAIKGINKKVLIVRCADILGAIDLIKQKCHVEMSPSNRLALLTFENENEAAECRKKINMKRISAHVIYCEHAPLCEENEEEIKRKAQTAKLKTNKIVVKNVPFQANITDLEAIFKTCENVTEIRLPSKNETMHRGFAFIVMDSPKNVAKVIEKFGINTHLFGRRLVLEPAKT